MLLSLKLRHRSPKLRPRALFRKCQGREVCAVFESFILGHFIHSLMGYGKRSSPRKSAALDEPLRARCLVRGLELLGLGAHFEFFGSLFVGKDPPAYHLNAELIGIVRDHKRHRNGADYPGCNGRALA